MQALRTWLRLLRGPQVPREDAHRSVCLTLSAVWFRVFTGCVATPQPYSRAFSSRPERSRHALEEPPLASAPSPQQPPASVLPMHVPPLGISHQRSRAPRCLLSLAYPLSRRSGLLRCSLCPPPVALWPSPSPGRGESTSCSSTHHCLTAELLPLFGYQTCGRKFSLLCLGVDCLKPGLDQNHFPEGLCHFPCPPALISHLVSVSCSLSAPS